jgi:hypothetical protein
MFSPELSSKLAGGFVKPHAVLKLTDVRYKSEEKRAFVSEFEIVDDCVLTDEYKENAESETPAAKKRKVDGGAAPTSSGKKTQSIASLNPYTGASASNRRRQTRYICRVRLIFFFEIHRSIATTFYTLVPIRPRRRGERRSLRTSPTSYVVAAPSFLPSFLHSFLPSFDYAGNWTIKAKLASKGAVRTFRNARGEGRVCTIELVDDNGTAIQATMWKDAIDKYDAMMEVGKVYYVSRGSLRPANRQYSNVNNDYEMSLDGKCDISPCEDPCDVSKMSRAYELVAIDALPTKIGTRGSGAFLFIRADWSPYDRVRLVHAVSRGPSSNAFQRTPPLPPLDHPQSTSSRASPPSASSAPSAARPMTPRSRCATSRSSTTRRRRCRSRSGASSRRSKANASRTRSAPSSRSAACASRTTTACRSPRCSDRS